MWRGWAAGGMAISAVSAAAIGTSMSINAAQKQRQYPGVCVRRIVNVNEPSLVMDVRLANLGPKPLIISSWHCGGHEGGQMAVEANESVRCFLTSKSEYNTMVNRGVALHLTSRDTLEKHTLPLPCESIGAQKKKVSRTR